MLLPLMCHQIHPLTQSVIPVAAHPAEMGNLFPASLCPERGKHKCSLFVLNMFKYIHPLSVKLMKTRIVAVISGVILKRQSASYNRRTLCFSTKTQYTVFVPKVEVVLQK